MHHGLGKKGVFLGVSLMILSCGKGVGDKSSLTCHAERKDYREEIVSTGTAQSVSTVTIACGNDIDGTIKYLVEDGTVVERGDTLCIIEDHNLENELDNLLNNLKTVEAERTKASATYHMEHAIQTARLESGLAEASIAALDSLQLQFAPPLQRRIKELNLRRAAINQERAKMNLRSMEVTWRVDSQRIASYSTYLRRRIADQRQRIAALILCAPQPGLAVIADSWREDRRLQVGDNVWERMPVVVLPDVSNMEVVMRIPESDYKRISLADPVDFTFTSDADARAWGHITKKMPVGMEAEEGSRVKLFEVTAAIDSTLRPVNPQSTARCSICLRLMEDVLVVPSVCVMDADSTKVVYVRGKGGHIEQREVEVAYSSSTETVIARGLTVDDELLLLQPASGGVRRKVFLNEE